MKVEALRMEEGSEGGREGRREGGKSRYDRKKVWD